MAFTRNKVKSYELQGQLYTIPNNGLVEKNIDTTGILDPWPAFSSQRAMPTNEIGLTKDKHLVVINDKHTKLPNITPKPKFLTYLEEYMNKELRKHSAEDVGSNSIRLDIYREVFDLLMEAFKTYKPIMSEVKREYECTIAQLKEQIRNLEPLKEMIWTVTEQKNREILQIMQQERDDVTILKAEKLDLMKQISQMEADKVTLEKQIEKLKESLEEEHHLRRNESDARKLLIIDINDKRQQLEDLQIIKHNTDDDERSNDDPAVLRIAFEEAKKGHSELLTELTRMKVNYSDVVPKKDYDALLENHTKLTDRSSAMEGSLAQLEVDHQALEEKYTALQQQRDFYNANYMELTRTSTPRPDWKKCGEFVSAGPTWWQQQYSDKSTKQLVDLLLQEINASSGVRQQVDGKGTDLSVLPFLRAEGKINLRSMPKRDIKIHIRDIWRDRKVLKDEQLEAISKNKEYILPPIAEFVDLFFKKTYGIEQIRIEWAYTFFDCLEKERQDPLMQQFYRILTKQMDEEVYWDEMLNLANLLELLRAKDSDQKKWINDKDMKELLESTFIKKPDEEILNEVLKSIPGEEHNLPSNEGETTEEGEQVTEKRITYEDLFMMTDEAEYSNFVNSIHKIQQDEKEAYIHEIEKELKDIGTKITSSQFKDCIQIVDPDIPDDIINKYMNWIFLTTNTEDGEKGDSIPLDHLINKLKMGCVKRYGLKN